MSKITAEHLQAHRLRLCPSIDPPISSCTILKASGGQYGPRRSRQSSLAGRPSRSSTTISDDRAEASPVQASSGCWPQSVTAELAAVLAIEGFHVSPATAATGTLLIEFCGLVGTILVDEDGILRSSPSQRSIIARHEGNDERT